jgi:hypothetical protein
MDRLGTGAGMVQEADIRMTGPSAKRNTLGAL